MTQTPQIPLIDPPEPLDESERLLARALRNLPAGSPPPELDARILGAARRAVHLSQPKKKNPRGWLIGLGTAASALIAVGVFVNMHGPVGNAALPIANASLEKAHARASAPSVQTQTAEEPAAADAAAPAPAVAAPPSMNREMPSAATGNPGAPTGAMQPAAQDLPQPHDEKAAAAKQVPNAFPTTHRNSPPPAPPPPVILEEPAPMSVPIMADAPAPLPPPPPPAAPARPATGDRTGTRAASAATAGRDDFIDAHAPAAGLPVTGQRQAPAKPAQSSDGTFSFGNAPVAGGTKDANVDAETVTGSVIAPADKTEESATTVAAQRKDQSAALKKSGPASDATQAADSAPVAGDANAKSLDTITVVGSQIRRVETETASPVVIISRSTAAVLSIDDDAKLPPTQWLDQIRERVKSDDDNGARASLQRFRARYPDTAIPDELQPLLK